MSHSNDQAASRMQARPQSVMIALVRELALAGCAKKKKPNSADDLGLGANAATPGSPQDFTVNVGDRIFFDTDSSSIRADAQADARPPGAVAEPVSELRASPSKAMPTNAAPANTTWRSAHAVPQPPATILARGRRRQPHEDDLLRQGKAGRRLRRHFLLVAEPPRRHDAERRRKLIAKFTFSAKGGLSAAFFVSGNVKQNLDEVSA